MTADGREKCKPKAKARLINVARLPDEWMRAYRFFTALADSTLGELAGYNASELETGYAVVRYHVTREAAIGGLIERMRSVGESKFDKAVIKAKAQIKAMEGKSKCCKSKLRISGGREGTQWYECTNCGKASDPLGS